MFYLNMFQVNKHWIQRHYITDMRLMTKNGCYVRYCHPMGWRVTKISKRILNLSITNLFRIFRNSPSCRISTTQGDKTPSPTQAGLHFIMVRRLQPGVLFLMGHQQWLSSFTLNPVTFNDSIMLYAEDKTLRGEMTRATVLKTSDEQLNQEAPPAY